MNIFLDTSSLFKLYHREADTGKVEAIFSENPITSVFLSEIAKIEFASTIWKKVRMQEITELQAGDIIGSFEADFSKYSFIQIDSMISHEAKNLITKYGKQGLRTLDSIQLSTSISLRDACQFFVTTDKLLLSFFKQESLPLPPFLQ